MKPRIQRVLTQWNPGSSASGSRTLQRRSLPARGRSDLGDELDDPASGATVGIQVRVIDRQAPAGAAAAVQSRLCELGELRPGQAAGQHDLASSAARCELAAPQDIEVDM